MFDAIGTLLIGSLLVVVAIVLGIETKSLLVGEGATDADHDRIVGAVTAGHEADRIIHLKTLYLGPDELMVAAKLAFPPNDARRRRARHRRDRSAGAGGRPTARVIYLEPDVRPAPAAADGGGSS